MPEDFWNLSPKDFHSFVLVKRSGLEIEYKTAWEQTRAIVRAVASPHLKKGTNIESIMPFPWDKKEANIIHSLKLPDNYKKLKEAMNKQRIKETS